MFEKREVTRAADATEQADLVKRLLEVLSSIDQTKEEAKSAASEYNGIIKDRHKREIGLRFNLQTGTVTQEIDVKPLINELTGYTEYYTHKGLEISELRHETSSKDKEQAALQRQMNMFGKESADPNDNPTTFEPGQRSQYLTAEEQALVDNATVTVSDDIFNTSPLGNWQQPEHPAGQHDKQETDLPDQLADVANTDFAGAQPDTATSTQPEIATATADYDPTPEHLDDLQHDHDVRNGRPPASYDVMTSEELISKVNKLAGFQNPTNEETKALIDAVPSDDEKSETEGPLLPRLEKKRKKRPESVTT